MVVHRDGTEIERLAIGQSLAPITSRTTLDYRYIPSAGWEPGEYDFKLILEATDPATGTVVLLDTTVLTSTVTVS